MLVPVLVIPLVSLILPTFLSVPEAKVVVVRLPVLEPLPPISLPDRSRVPPSRLSTAVLAPVAAPRMMSPVTVSVPPVRLIVPVADPPAAEASPSLIAVPALPATVTVEPERFKVPVARAVVPEFTPMRMGLASELKIAAPAPPRFIVAVALLPVVAFEPRIKSLASSVPVSKVKVAVACPPTVPARCASCMTSKRRSAERPVTSKVAAIGAPVAPPVKAMFRLARPLTGSA